MSHTIAEDVKIRPTGTYYLNIVHSGGETRAGIIFCAKEGENRWRTVLKERGRNAEEHAMEYWRTL